MPTYNFTTGSTVLPDIGTLSYNGCIFSPLFESNISGNAVKDDARRTVKYTEITLTVDGYVTMQGYGPTARLGDISLTMNTMHRLLTAQGGALTYKGRGFDIAISGAGGNVAGPIGQGSNIDVAWGPTPELIEFQPLGGGLSAKVKWKVTIHITPIIPGKGFRGSSKALTSPLLQFNYETSVTYGEDGYSALSMRGVLEVPMSRAGLSANGSMQFTADNYRRVIGDRLLRDLDLSRFRITHREFSTSRDKRTLTWDISAEEKPYMDLPPYCTVARGTYNVRPAKTGPGLALWLCTLQATYTLHAMAPRRQAYLLFLALMRLRMSEATSCNITDMNNGDQQGKDHPIVDFFSNIREAVTFGVGKLIRGGFKQGDVNTIRKAILLDFNISEGLYLDSKTVSFSATWRITTTFSHILVASGLWTKIKETGADGRNLWSTSIGNYSGTTSWFTNRLNPNLDVIVDFGSTG